MHLPVEPSWEDVFVSIIDAVPTSAIPPINQLVVTAHVTAPSKFRGFGYSTQKNTQIPDYLKFKGVVRVNSNQYRQVVHDCAKPIIKPYAYIINWLMCDVLKTQISDPVRHNGFVRIKHFYYAHSAFSVKTP
jgi:hypothetical protein